MSGAVAAPDDLRSAARIRAAALEGFATRGFAATSIRQVAAAAGVSAGLVQHHFPSKAALREAVDAYVLKQAAAALSGLPAPGEGDAAEELGKRITAIFRDQPLGLRYVARGLVDGDEQALGLFDGLVALADAVVEEDLRVGRMRTDADPVWARLHLLVYNLGVVLLEQAIDRQLPEPLRSDEGLERWRAATTAVFRHGLYRPGR